MVKKFLAFTFIALFLVSAVSAQFVDDASTSSYKSSNLDLAPAVSPFSLIDFSRVRWSNSYSVSFFSGGNSSGSLGMWNSNVSYDLSRSLSIGLNVNLLHSPSGLLGNTNSDAIILPGFSLDYHPSRNFNLRIDYRTLDIQRNSWYRRGY
ncbi:MAG: hypothetical protein P1R58_02615 [bacterium]|nr:hypothetical protein [bacterium]